MPGATTPPATAPSTTPPIRQPRRWLRRLGCGFAAMGLLILMLVSIFLANPFEGEIDSDLIDLAPPDAPIFVQIRDLSAIQKSVRSSRFWSEELAQGGWRRFLTSGAIEDATGNGASTDGAAAETALVRVLTELEQSPQLAALLLMLAEDVIGEESALAVYPGRDGALDWTLTSKIGYGSKLLFGSGELFGVRMKLATSARLGGLEIERLEAQHLVVRQLPGVEALHISRERNLLVVSTQADAIKEIRARMSEGSTARSLRDQFLYRRVTEPLKATLGQAGILGYLEIQLLAGRGFDLETIVQEFLGADGRALAFESIDFAAWRSLGLHLPLGDEVRAQLVVSLDPDRGTRMQRLESVYRSEADELSTLSVLPGDVAFSKTACLPFDVFFDLIFANLSNKTRENINYYILDQLQEAAAKIRPEYARLVAHLAQCLGDEFTIFAVPSRFDGSEELIEYFPRMGVIFKVEDAPAVRLLIKDISDVLPQINENLFTAEKNIPEEQDGVMIFRVQSDFAPLQQFYEITPSFVISESFVVLVSSEELVQPIAQALRGESKRSNKPAIAHGAIRLEGAHFHQMLEDSWMQFRLPYLSQEGEIRNRRREELIRKRMVDEGVTRLGSQELQTWNEWAEGVMEEHDEAVALERELAEYLAPIKKAYRSRIAPVANIGSLILDLEYSPTRLLMEIEVKPGR